MALTQHEVKTLINGHYGVVYLVSNRYSPALIWGRLLMTDLPTVVQLWPPKNQIVSGLRNRLTHKKNNVIINKWLKNSDLKGLSMRDHHRCVRLHSIWHNKALVLNKNLQNQILILILLTTKQTPTTSLERRSNPITINMHVI